MKRKLTNAGVLHIFLALLLVITVMFASNFIVYRNSISGIYEKVTQNNALVMRSIVQSFDSSFRSVHNMIQSIHALPYDNDARSGGQPDMSEIYLFQGQLASMASGLDYIEDIIVFYDHSNLAITARGTSDLKALFTGKYRHEMYNAEYWRSFAATKHSFKAFPSVEYKVFSEGNQFKTKRLMALVGGNKIRMSSKNILILVNTDALLRHVDQKAMLPGASLIVMDQDRTPILNTDGNWGLMDILSDVYFQSPSGTSVTREDYEYNFYVSPYNSYVYIDKVPFQFRNIDSVHQANQTTMLIAIACAMLLAALLSFTLYRPVKQILRLFGEGQVKGNDFRKIYSGILKLQMENESYRKQLDLADSELRKVVFFQALDEYPREEEQDALLRRHYPDLFSHNFFVMVYVRMAHQAKDRTPSTTIEEIELRLRAAFSGSRMDANVFHAGRLQFLSLLGLNQQPGREALLRRLNAAIAQLEKELPGFLIRGCVSRLFETRVTNFPPAYEEVLRAMPYRRLKDSPLVDAEAVQYEWNVYFPFERVEKLSNLLLNGRLDDVKDIVRETLQENEERNVLHGQLSHIADALFYSMLQIAEGNGAGHSTLYQWELDFRKAVEESCTVRDIEAALVAAAAQAASGIRDDQRSKLNPAFISQYIDLHYMENLYLDHMAELFETTPKYFSNYFKKTFGVNYVEYLNKVRLSHAKVLLKDSGLSVAEIGEKTGYVNSSTFTTTFKKYYGISPSEYRKRQAG